MTAVLDNYGHDLSTECLLTCSDFSEGMIEQVRQTKSKQVAAGDKHWSRVETIVSNAMDMSAASDTQSHILAGLVYFMTPDPQKCLSESMRMLKPGGVLGLSSWEDSQWLEMMRQLTVVLPERKVPELPKEWSSSGAVQQELNIAGFVDVSSKPLTVYMDYKSHAELAKFLTTSMPPIFAAMKDLNEADVQRVHEAMIRKAREYNPKEPGRLSGQAIVAVGSKPKA